MNKFPNLHAEEKRLETIIQWPNELLTRKHQEYCQYAQEDRFMPRAQEVIRRLINHVEFEQRERLRDGGEY